MLVFEFFFWLFQVFWRQRGQLPCVWDFGTQIEIFLESTLTSKAPWCLKDARMLDTILIQPNPSSIWSKKPMPTLSKSSKLLLWSNCSSFGRIGVHSVEGPLASIKGSSSLSEKLWQPAILDELPAHTVECIIWPNRKQLRSNGRMRSNLNYTHIPATLQLRRPGLVA